MVTVGSNRTPSNSSDVSGSTSPGECQSGSENGNLMYMLKNCLIISKDVVNRSMCNENIKYCGFENRSNNCYCNVVLQSLYSSHDFRTRMIRLKKIGTGISGELGKLYSKCVAANGIVIYIFSGFYDVIEIQSPKSFLKKVCSTNDDFVLGDQQDAHEFLTYIINLMIDEIRELEDDYLRPKSQSLKNTGKRKTEKRTWLNELVEGFVKSETRCHECKNVTGIMEPFITISLDINDNCDINSCLERYCDAELLTGKDQFFCDTCNKYCDASKKVVFDLMPPLLILHLKRFKYNVQAGNNQKDIYSAFERLPYSVISRNIIKIKCQRHTHPIVYELFSVILHIGTSPHYGHYINISRMGEQWFKCDDTSIHKLHNFHQDVGDEHSSGSDGSYILFYRIKE
ncbi:Ubiquitin carboxyl-terminal hydrolase family member protein [Theileria equi strain WA]|uniref:ubiquitinyl hydrolase 1 n=1 Tax=Theileria equi strain WA TaxID=1537102 RepID=L0AVT0_THEEQ|nr:Ubiquitin carboxyl-terminal hydrolase family member protein [Theileria equi strain WA]AFZ78994.1 Ubiquitin carboxyl-terminal hydrolase family member protein [Theileria equi strain WA]|eukprot:XP_004828660.1 Ubiquitin carboxyl-terminal hydrolase family member protein [Theileria equi strain WA]